MQVQYNIRVHKYKHAHTKPNITKNTCINMPTYIYAQTYIGLYVCVHGSTTCDPSMIASLSRNNVRWLVRLKLPVSHLPEGT